MANPYATPQQLFQRMDARIAQQLSGDQNAPQGTPTNIAALLDSAASVVDSTLAGRVPLPLTAPPLVLTDIVCDIVAYRLFGRRSDMPPAVKAAYEYAQQWLKDFRNGAVTLPGVTPAAPSLADSDFTDGRSRFDRVFGQCPSPTGPSKGL